MIYAFLAICLFSGALAGPTKPACPDVSFDESFDMDRFVGHWYIAERTDPSNETDCSSMYWGLRGSMGNSSDRYQVPRRRSDPSKLASDNYSYRTSSFEWGSVGLSVLATDHTSYTIFYRCNIEDGQSAKIMTKHRQPASDVLPKAHKILKEKNLGDVKFFPVNQLGCEPTPDILTKPACPDVSFDESFDMDRFVGHWYIAERTDPSNETDCSSMYWGLRGSMGNSSDRYQVPRRRSDPFKLASDNYSYRTSSFEWGSVGLSVLATDHTSYTIFYRCNIEDGQSAKIMTRHRQPASDVLPKAHKILKEKNLGDVTFFPVNQLGCEPTPDIPTKPACPDVSFDENFNMDRFLGYWYIAERTDPSNKTDCSSMYWGLRGSMGNSSSRLLFPRRRSNPSKLASDSYYYRESSFEWGSVGLEVLATDHTSYTIFYRCDIEDGQSAEIMTRNRQPADDVLRKAHAILQEKNLSDIKFFPVNQSGC